VLRPEVHGTLVAAGCWASTAAGRVPAELGFPAASTGQLQLYALQAVNGVILDSSTGTGRLQCVSLWATERQAPSRDRSDMHMAGLAPLGAQENACYLHHPLLHSAYTCMHTQLMCRHTSPCRPATHPARLWRRRSSPLPDHALPAALETWPILPRARPVLLPPPAPLLELLWRPVALLTAQRPLGVPSAPSLALPGARLPARRLALPPELLPLGQVLPLVLPGLPQLLEGCLQSLASLQHAHVGSLSSMPCSQSMT
jgi:hypothetical protein